MSQSETHKELVVDTLRELNDRFPNRKYYVDGVESLGYDKPFSIRNLATRKRLPLNILLPSSMWHLCL